MSQESLYNDDFTLLQNLRGGDVSAFRYIYETHYRPLWHFANRLIKDSHQAEDIITESFIALWNKRIEFESFKGLTAFLYTCTKNACTNHINKIRRHSFSHREMTYLFEHTVPFDNIDDIRNDLIHFSIIESENLPQGMKNIFQLLYIDGFSATEIAQKLHLSVHTVRAQKANAIKRVRENLLKRGLLSWVF